ncbi:MAG: ABC transporter substrate-binding protein, partial [Stellaceae bacterium]
MKRIHRRRVLQLSGAGALASATGGLAAILASGRAPAYGQAMSVHYLRWSDFVPASDMLLKNQIAPECEKELGIKLRLEMVNANDIQARVTSSIQSGTGPDIVLALNNWPQLYTASLADVSDIAEKRGEDQGGYYDISKKVATVGNKWIGMPWCIGGGLVAYRKSWFSEIGYDKFPETWDKLQAAGKELKAKGRPIGQA